MSAPAFVPDTTNGLPIGSSLIEESLAVLLANPNLQTGTKLSGWDLLSYSPAVQAHIDFNSAAFSNDHMLGGLSGAFLVVIQNRLSTPLRLTGFYDGHGTQAGYPVISDLNGLQIADSAHQIPAGRPHPAKAGTTLAGLGAYIFTANALGEQSCCLELSAEIGKGRRLGIATKQGWLWDHPISAVSADLPGTPDDLYNSLDSAGKNTLTDSNGDVAISGLYFRQDRSYSYSYSATGLNYTMARTSRTYYWLMVDVAPPNS